MCVCDVKLCDVNLCDVNLCDVKLCDVNLCDVNLYGVNLCDVKLCDVNLCDFNLCDVNLCDVNLCDAKLCDVNLCHVNLCDVKLCDVSARGCDVNLCGVCLCDVNLCNVNLCDFNLCDVNLCDVNLCYVKLRDVNLCDVNLCDVKLCDVSVRVCDVNLCGDFSLHIARRQTRMPARHPRKIFAPPIGTATPNAIYTQQAAKPACQEDINTQKQRQSGGAQNAPKRTSDPVMLLQAPRLPRKSSGRAAEPKTRQSVHQTPRCCSKSHACHAKAAAERRSPKRAKAYIRPRASAPSPTPATQEQRQSSGRAAERTTRQRVHQTPRKCSKPHACHAKAAAERRSPKRAKAYIRPRAAAPSPTPATQKQRQSGGAQNAPKRTSDPVQVLQVPRLPRKSSGRAKTRQSVHQTPRKRSKSHARHAKAAAERRSPKRAKAYIRPRASAPSPTPATQKQRQSGGAQNAPKRTSDPAQALQVPRLPR